MKVPYSYLDRQFSEPDKIWAEVKKVVMSGDFTLGKAVTEFEGRFAELIGTKYAVGVGSGTDALFLSLKALGIGNDHTDEVITTANTFVATAGAIETAGAKIVFVDCNDRYVMDVNIVEKAITPRTKAIMPVHFAGQPVDMTHLMAIAKKHNLPVIEDACQSIDSSFDGKRCGAIGITGGFSLHPLKNLNVWSDGGLVTTNSEEVRDKLRLLRNHGMVNRDEYAFYAYNSRLDSVQAAVGNYMIGDAKRITDRRIEVADTYDAALKDLKEFIYIPERKSNERNVYHLYMMLVKDRDQLLAFLNKNEIEAKIHYPIPLHLQQASKHLGYKRGDFPVAEKQAASLITLPVHQHLRDDEIKFAVSKVREFYQNKMKGH